MSLEGIIIANFGGPRTQDEIEEFLKTLLCDQDVVRTGFPQAVHNLLFSYIAKKRTKKISADYEHIGGASPIFYDTERLKNFLIEKLKVPVFAFHRYLPKTHAKFLEEVNSFQGHNLLVFPMFPQFSYATGGSCARFFEQNLCGRTLEKILWIPSYESHSAFIEAYKKQIKTHIQKNNLREEDVCLFYSCHGVPRKFVCFNDPYEKHCQLSYQALKAHFPHADHVLAFQSKFGKGEWLRPYTIDLVEKDLSWCQKKHVLFVPLSFTSDHIETLHEIENEYIQPLKDKGIDAQRINSLSDDFSWVCPIIEDRGPSVSNAMLIRKDKAACCQISHDCCLCKQKSSKKNLFKGQVQQDRR